MDWLLIIAGIILLLTGIVGCFLPVIPGPPLAWLALLLLQFTSKAPFTTDFLMLWAFITAAVTLLDYWLPVYGTKKLGGSVWGIRGATIGLLIGLFFFPPFGLIVGPFAGALLAELFAGKSSEMALKSALGSFVGFLAGTAMKLAVSVVMAWYFVINLWS
jgi:uncharacterized protein